MSALRCIWPYGTPQLHPQAKYVDSIVTASTAVADYAALQALPRNPLVVGSFEPGLCVPLAQQDESRRQASIRQLAALTANEWGLLTRRILWGPYEAIRLDDRQRVRDYFGALGEAVGMRATIDLHRMDALVIDSSIFTDPTFRVEMGGPTDYEEMREFVRECNAAFADAYSAARISRIPLIVNSLGIGEDGRLDTFSLQGLDSVARGIKIESWGNARSDAHGSGWEKMRAHCDLALRAARARQIQVINFEADAALKDEDGKDVSDETRRRWYAAAAVFFSALDLVSKARCYWTSDRYLGTGTDIDPDDLTRANKVLNSAWASCETPLRPDNIVTIRSAGGAVRRLYWDESDGLPAVAATGA